MDERKLKLKAAILKNNLNYINKALEVSIDWLNEPLPDEEYQNKLPIHFAAEYGQAEIIELFLSKKPALLNQTDEYGQTAVCWAAMNNHDEAVEFLAEAGADLNITTERPGHKDHGKGPIHWATEQDNDELVLILIQFKASIDKRIGTNQSHLIHIAAIIGNIDIIIILLGIDEHLITLTDGNGNTPLILAAIYNRLSVLTFLEQIGGDVNDETDCVQSPSHGKLAIQWATELGHARIVQFLINNKSEINMLMGPEHLHLIHIASIKGYLEIVILFLNHSPNLLNTTDKHNTTPVHWATIAGHIDLVLYFASKGADLTTVIVNPNVADNGMTPFESALSNKHYEIANILFLNSSTERSKDTIATLIVNGSQALDLMARDPSLSKMLLQDARIKGLINATFYHINEDNLDWYKVAGRRPSFFVRINLKNETSTFFKPILKLGEGGNGVVRLFQDEKGNEVAVKSILTVPITKQLPLAQVLNNDAAFKKELYPEDEYNEVFHISYEKDNQKLYTNRLVMERIKIANAFIFMPKVHDEHLLARIVLKIIQELERIHGKGILHGDINPNNIMINIDNDIISIRFIDFGNSYRLSSEKAPFWNLNEEDRRWYPPEICNPALQPVKPHTNQNVFSFGYCLNILLERHPFKYKLFKNYPSIELFITQALHRSPVDRPKLQTVITQLGREIAVTARFEQAFRSENQDISNSKSISNTSLATADSRIHQDNVSTTSAIDGAPENEFQIESGSAGSLISGAPRRFWNKLTNRVLPADDDSDDYSNQCKCVIL